MVMTPTEIEEQLCSYDTRNPFYDSEMSGDREPRVDCACDNCFNGRDLLAREILDRRIKMDEKWVLVFDLPGLTRYAKEPFCGGTFDIEEAKLYDVAPTSLIGTAVRVRVKTTVEIVTS